MPIVGGTITSDLTRYCVLGAWRWPLFNSQTLYSAGRRPLEVTYFTGLTRSAMLAGSSHER